MELELQNNFDVQLLANAEFFIIKSPVEMDLELTYAKH